MRRNCKKAKPATPRGRTRPCYYWHILPCRPQRTRSRFTPPFGSDPCLGGREHRREPARPTLGY